MVSDYRGVYSHGQAPPPPGPPARGGNPWPWIAVSVALLAAAAVAIVLILTGGGDPEAVAAKPAAAQAKHGSEDIAALIDPVGEGNDALSEELDVLDPGDDPDSALAVLGSARQATTVARRELVALGLSPADDRLREDTQRALARELSYLGVLRSALRQRSAGRARVARRQAALARPQWSVVRREIPGAGGRIAGLVALTAWAAPPTLEDGDAGPAVATDQAPADPIPAPNEIVDCGAYEGLSYITAQGVDCSEAIDSVMGFASGKSAAAANGFVCEEAPEEAPEPGIARYECDRYDGAHIGFDLSL